MAIFPLFKGLVSGVLLQSAAAASHESASSPVRKQRKGSASLEKQLLSFDEFTVAHGRNYAQGSSEYDMRRSIYERRLEAIGAQNAMPDRMWTAGINHLADQTEEEFNMLLGWHHAPGSRRSSGKGASLLESEGAPPLADNVTWTHLTLGKVVADQGSCGSCWAMAAAATLTANYEIRYGVHKKFSPQEFVDCVQNPLVCGGKGGCDGATVELAMDWAIYNGLATLNETSYQASRGSCKKGLFRATAEEQGKLDADGRLVEMFKPSTMSLVSSGDKLSIGLSSYTTLPTNKLEPLLRAVNTGPVAISVDASGWSSYVNGVFDGCKGELATINHAVVLFGYGGVGSSKYWLVRNSWGQSWGEDGYIKLFRSDNEEAQCYTDSEPLQGVSCTGAPKSVKVCGQCGILYDNVVPNFEGSNVHVQPKINVPPSSAEGGGAPSSGGNVFIAEEVSTD